MKKKRVGRHKVRGDLIFSVSHPYSENTEFRQGQLSEGYVKRARLSFKHRNPLHTFCTAQCV